MLMVSHVWLAYNKKTYGAPRRGETKVAKKKVMASFMIAVVALPKIKAKQWHVKDPTW